MGIEPGSGVMRRLARPAAPPAPQTSSRALRLAMVRAAETSVALPLAVLGIREEEGTLDLLLGRLEEGLMILALRDGQAPAGLVALDTEARAAVIEAQALGGVSTSPPEPRAPTTADAALARPLLTAFLREAQEAVAGTPLADWLKGPHLGDRLPSEREAALLLPDGAYRAVRLTLDLGAGGRQGLLVLMLRLPPPAPSAEALAPDMTVAEQVMDATIRAEAVLHRLRLSLAEAEGLQVGQVLPLPGVTLSSVRLAAGGHDLGPGRLGQLAGMRAVRIEQAMSPLLGELPVPGAGLPSVHAVGDGPLLPAPWSDPQSEEAPAWGPPGEMPMD